MKSKLLLAIVLLISTSSFAATPPAAGFSLGRTDALLLGTVAALLLAVILFRAQVRQYAKRQLNK
jgi:uncharacterized membrane protein YccC